MAPTYPGNEGQAPIIIITIIIIIIYLISCLRLSFEWKGTLAICMEFQTFVVIMLVH